jgi:predicted CopG family antitoxin
MSTDREKTNIEVYRETWQRLNHLKERPGDSFDDVINRLIDEYEKSGEE